MSKNKIVILGHANPDVDSIISGIILEYFLNNHTKYQAEFIIPDKILDKSTLDICQKYQISLAKYQRKLTENDQTIILVDHYERNLPNKKIIAIFDHHPTTKEIKVPIYINKKISSTATLLTKGNEKYFNKELLNLALLASYVDTASFNSTKARIEDKIWAENLIKKYNLDKEDLYQTCLSLTDLSNLEEATFSCLKKYNISNKKVEISSLQISGVEEHKEELVKIKEIVLNYFLKHNLDVYILIVHDMNVMKSTAYKIFKDGIEIDHYDKYTSRGNTIIPKLEQEINNHTFTENLIKEKKKTIVN